MMRVVVASARHHHHHKNNGMMMMRPIVRRHGQQQVLKVGLVAASTNSSSSGSRSYWMATTNHTTTTLTEKKKKKSSSTRGSTGGDYKTAATNILMAVAAMVSFTRPIMTMAEGRVKTKDKSNEGAKNLKFPHNGKPCPTYGCPLFPLDVVEQPPNDPNHNHRHLSAGGQVFQSLNEIRNSTRQELQADDQKVNLTTLSSTANYHQGTMMMTGYKGGPPAQQINQDRAIVVGPYYIPGTSSESILLGVFDGHASRGELVSEFVVTELPKLLAKRLEEALSTSTTSDDANDEQEIVKKVLGQVFVELDKQSPADPTGGCTASIILKFNNCLYVANAGDSISMIGMYQKSTQTTAILYTSREDKPHLPDERQRVEQAGGYVYVPPRGTSRVVYVNPMTGAQTGLAMSRSIGDWSFGKLGVIPDPIVDTIHIPTLISNITHANSTDADAVDPPPVQNDDIYIFGISGTDGMMDYVAKDGIAQVVSQSLFEPNGTHPATACELLVKAAAQGWEKFRQGRYRDDIAIAIATLREPTTASTEEMKDDDESSSTQKEEL